MPREYPQRPGQSWHLNAWSWGSMDPLLSLYHGGYLANSSGVNGAVDNGCRSSGLPPSAYQGLHLSKGKQAPLREAEGFPWLLTF